MNFDYARRQMVDQQVRAWDVLESSVLDVLHATPREQFVPERYKALAFADVEIPIGHGECMLTPTVEGRILQALQLDEDQSVLEIGTGTGFLTACLATLAATVTSIDIHDDFLREAARRLEEIGIDNAELQAMDATRELPAGHYDAIAVCGSIQFFDPRYVRALKDGGRLFVVVGEAPVMEALLVVRTGDNDWRSESLFETRVKSLVNGALPPQFRF